MKTSYPRDSQRKRVFSCEQTIAVNASIVQLQTFGEGIVHEIWGQDFQVTHMRNSSLCYAFLRGIVVEIPLNTHVGFASVCHAIAHRQSLPSHFSAWHGPNFCSAYLQLVDRFMGVDAKKHLAQAFKVENVKTRYVSEEQYAAKKDAAVKRKQASLERKTEALEDNLKALLERLS